ncbi:cytochrome c oxidase subunit 3 family protein [Colwellia sp. 12G3]|uniref:cytochrome c oxidase subunit 3 family protein n=1 Tax=Colwellia sp. 12G3 TaxID=2058299 RepID=UPI001E308576|nr:cytochrome c oxidase subunit 3 family protein [Colwellia sp. 12G3]
MSNSSIALVHQDRVFPDKKLPGDLAMWFFILAELTVFALFFIGFAVSEQLNETMFSQGKAQLHQMSGLINTIALITSSFFVALALTAMHKAQAKKAVLLLLTAKVFALIYISVKVWEYLSLFKQGITIETNTFFTLYFLITAFHLMHVLLGMVILAFLAYSAWHDKYLNNDLSGFEAGTSYWHMVDLLWIILFPLIYVI